MIFQKAITQLNSYFDKIDTIELPTLKPDRKFFRCGIYQIRECSVVNWGSAQRTVKHHKSVGIANL